MRLQKCVLLFSHQWPPNPGVTYSIILGSVLSARGGTTEQKGTEEQSQKR